MSGPSPRREGAQTECEGNWAEEQVKYRITKMDKLTTERDASPFFTSLLTYPPLLALPTRSCNKEEKKTARNPPIVDKGKFVISPGDVTEVRP